MEQGPARGEGEVACWRPLLGRWACRGMEPVWSPRGRSTGLLAQVKVAATPVGLASGARDLSGAV
jgi:hypothetical protein